MRDAIARWLSPELARKADERDWLVSEISHNARWLSEFKFVSRTLDRILDLLHDNFPPGDLKVCFEPADISAYRELLRREAIEAEIGADRSVITTKNPPWEAGDDSRRLTNLPPTPYIEAAKIWGGLMEKYAADTTAHTWAWESFLAALRVYEFERAKGL